MTTRHLSSVGPARLAVARFEHGHQRLIGVRMRIGVTLTGPQAT